MQKVLTAEEVREVDRLTTEKYGIQSIILMENAAHAIARTLTEKLIGNINARSYLILCGRGNNGGDGAALARILATMGAKVDVYLFGKIEESRGDARTNFEILNNLQKTDFSEFITFQEIATRIEINFSQYNVVIDALIGTGLNRPLRANEQRILEMWRKAKATDQQPLFVSIDLPTGLDADLPQPIGENFNSDLTVTFTAPKLANVFPPASDFNGELIVTNIGSPPELIENSPSQLYLAEKSDAQDWLKSTEVQRHSYKKTRGTALIIAGSDEYSGAAVLAANACFAAGTGVVTVAVSTDILSIVASKTLDEIIIKPIENIDFSANVTAIGCGLSNDKATTELIREMVKNRATPMLLDAQALNALSPFDLLCSKEFPIVLTPHLGEFERLLGRAVGANRIEEVRNFAQRYNVILLLKGERSLVGKPDGTVVINPTGNAGVSRAGAGDTLAGIITGFLAQSAAIRTLNIDSAFEAVVAALYISGTAGDIAAEKHSSRLVSATDIRESLQIAIERLSL